MRTIQCLLMGLALSLMAGAAWAQDDLSAGGEIGADTSTGEAEAEAETDAEPAATREDSDDGERSYPSFSLGAKLELMTAQLDLDGVNLGLMQMTHPVLVEFSVDIFSRLSVFAVLGTYLGLSHQETSDAETKTNQGVLLLGAGARFNFQEPRAEHAHLYVAADVIGAIGLASRDETDMDSGDLEAEEDVFKEQQDHILFGAAMGMEYLPVPEFGIGAEVWLRFLINGLKDTNPDVNFDKCYAAAMVTTFGLRFTYHF